MPSKKDSNSQNKHRESTLRVETNMQGTIIDNPTEFNQRTYRVNMQQESNPSPNSMNMVMGKPEAQETRAKSRKTKKPTKQINKGTMTSRDPKLDEAIKKDNESKGIYNNGKQQGN